MAVDVALARGFALALTELEKRGMGRKEVAAELGVEAPTISRYVTGERSVPIEHLPRIDALLGRPRGHVLRLAGYVTDTVDLVAAVHQDPHLDEDSRGAMLLLYSVFLKRSER